MPNSASRGERDWKTFSERRQIGTTSSPAASAALLDAPLSELDGKIIPDGEGLSTSCDPDIVGGCTYPALSKQVLSTPPHEYSGGDESERRRFPLDVDLGRSSDLTGQNKGLTASEMDQLVSRLQRDLASALDSKLLSQEQCDELTKMHGKKLRELEAFAADLSTARRQLAEAQRSEKTCQNDLVVALHQGAKLSKQHEQSQADVATLKADVYKLGQQLLESMNAQDDLMDQSMVLLKQRDEACRSRDEARKELDRLKEENMTKSAESSSTQLAGDSFEAMRVLRDTAIEQRQDTAKHLTAAREECQELRSRLAAKERLLQEQCRRMLGGSVASDGSGYSSSDGSHSDSGASRQRVRELHQELIRLRKDYKERCDECELLRQQCIVAKKERADSLNEQESIISRNYRVQQEMVAVKEELQNTQQTLVKLKADLAKAEQNLKVAQKEKSEAQQSRDWAFEERTRIINERDMARADSTDLQRSRDKAVSDHVMTMREADSLRHELDNVTRDLHSCKALKEMYCTQLNGQAHYWQADYVSKEVQMRKGIDGQLGFTIGGGQDHPDVKLGPVIQVVDVLDGGPAFDILRCDDLLVMINSQDLTNVTQATAAKMLREASSPLKIVLRRKGTRVDATPFEISLQGSKDYGIQLESHIVVTGLTANSIVGNKVQPGDRILKVDSMAVTNMDIGRVTHSIKATKRSNPIKLTLLRQTAAPSVRRPFTASSSRRTRSVGSGNSGPGVPPSGTASSLGLPSASFGDSISNTVGSGGEHLSLEDGEYVVSSGHGTMSSTERYTPSSHDRLLIQPIAHHRRPLASVHSASSGSGDRTMAVNANLPATGAPANPEHQAPTGSNGSSSSRNVQRKLSGGRESSRQNSNSSSLGMDNAATATSTQVTTPATPIAPKPAASSSSSGDGRGAKDAHELQPLLDSVKHGEKRLQALQKSRAQGEVEDKADGSQAIDPRTRSMPMSGAGLLQEAISNQASRRSGSRRSSLPLHSQGLDKEHPGSISSNGSSTSSMAGGTGSATGSSIEAGVGGSDNIHSPMIRSPSSEGQRSIRFVVLSRNPTNGTLGFCIQGGNSSGIFISQITDAAASRGEGPGGGLQVGDRILEVNGTVLSNATREMAASCLRQSTSSVLITVKNDKVGFQGITQPYDSLWLTANFAFLANHQWQVTFPKGSLLHIIDTMPKKANHWEATLFDSKGRASRSGMVPSRIGVKSGKLSGVTSLEEGGDPFSEAEPPPPPPSSTQGAVSTVF